MKVFPKKAILDLLARFPGETEERIAGRLKVSRASCNRFLRALRKDGMVAFSVDKQPTCTEPRKPRKWVTTDKGFKILELEK